MKRRISLLMVLVLILTMMTGISAGAEEGHDSEISLNYNEINMFIGDTFQLKLTNSSEKCKWESSSKCVTVSSTGALKAKKKGEAKITCNAGNKKYICNVKVVGIYSDKLALKYLKIKYWNTGKQGFKDYNNYAVEVKNTTSSNFYLQLWFKTYDGKSEVSNDPGYRNYCLEAGKSMISEDLLMFSGYDRLKVYVPDHSLEKLSNDYVSMVDKVSIEHTKDTDGVHISMSTTSTRPLNVDAVVVFYNAKNEIVSVEDVPYSGHLLKVGKPEDSIVKFPLYAKNFDHYKIVCNYAYTNKTLKDLFS